MMKIIFSPSTKEVERLVEPPVPSKLTVPRWYKQSPSFDSKNIKLDNNKVVNTTLKMCMPFFDAMAGGYIQKTWTDIFIGVENNDLKYSAATLPSILGVRDSVSIDITDNYYPAEFVWHRQWTAKLPKGYSLLITHPHNRLDLPFTTLSGFIDSDVFYHTPIGNIPFFVYKNFQGVIPAGTPMYQMIPIKRDAWERIIEKFDEEKWSMLNHKIRSKFFNGYRDLFWNKKQYN